MSVGASRYGESMDLGERMDEPEPLDEDDFLRVGVRDQIRDYLISAGLLDEEDFPAIKDDVGELARSIVRHVEGQYGM